MMHIAFHWPRHLAAATLISLTPLAALAEVRGLIVGVSDYEFLNADLRGPANDVGLVSDMLLARGAAPDAITVLAAPDVRLDQRLSVAAAPTRAAIVEGLTTLAEAAGPGDTVVFYFSGHGSQMPDASGDEAGGYDEILLPADAKNWKGAIGAVENALVDDELAVLMQAILDTGAELVAILDACHSATGFRALVDPRVSAARYIDPVALGVPDAVEGDGEPGQLAPPLEGRFVFLYSSQSDQRSFEYPVGDKALDENWYGDFTRALMPVLTVANGLSWAQALMAAVDGMAKDGPAAQTPDAEGPLLDRAVFGAAAEVAPVWRTEGGTLKAGLLNGVEPGAQVAVFPDAAAEGAAVIAEVAEAKAATAVLARNPGLPSEGYARLHRPALPAPLKLGAPVVADGATPGELPALLATLTEGLDGIADADGEAPDLVPVFTGTTLALAGRDGVLDGLGAGSSPRLAPGAGAAELTAFLDRAVRTHRLRRALKAAEGGATAFALPGAGLTVELSHVDVPGRDGACGEPSAEAPVRGEVRASACDQLWLEVTNNSKTARDITVLYIDRDFGVTAIFPDGALSNRLNFGETQEIGVLIINRPDVPGQEEIVVLAAPAAQGAPRTVLTALADPAQMRAMASEASALGEWLFAAADPETTIRNFSFGGALPSLEVTRFRITLAPAGTH